MMHRSHFIISGAFRVEMQRESQKDRTILCKYEPTEPGDYRIEVILLLKVVHLLSWPKFRIYVNLVLFFMFVNYEICKH